MFIKELFCKDIIEENNNLNNENNKLKEEIITNKIKCQKNIDATNKFYKNILKTKTKGV